MYNRVNPQAIQVFVDNFCTKCLSYSNENHLEDALPVPSSSELSNSMTLWDTSKPIALRPAAISSALVGPVTTTAIEDNGSNNAKK